MKHSLFFVIFCLLLTPVAAHSDDTNAAKIASIQQARIQMLEKQVADLQNQLSTLSSKLAKDYTTTEKQQSTFVSKSDFTSTLADATGIACDGSTCAINRFLRISPPGLGRNIHIPESWGGHQPYVYCDANGCYALLKW
ncbi:hypothetical protein [Oligoflexus tunisiensis]|uniref:hypothetical protein n=1 Tax=Oligoflexus tunisiensis TaxID=708132 RepID=UPI00114D1585|nr:hypothetical protein [Oligoflexus tunisiensis]